jgi:hypothetical protein
MKFTHESKVAPLFHGAARHLPLKTTQRLQARQAGWLTVLVGRAWITRDGEGVDHVLAAGDHLWLALGDRVVAEPWSADQVTHIGWVAPVASALRPAQGAQRQLSSFASRAISAITAARGARRPSSSATTVSVIGIST